MVRALSSQQHLICPISHSLTTLVICVIDANEEKVEEDMCEENVVHPTKKHRSNVSLKNKQQIPYKT